MQTLPFSLFRALSWAIIIAMNVLRVIEKLDELNNSGHEKEGEKHLEKWLEEARAEKDWKAELTILGELLGQYRRTLNEECGLQTADKVLKILDEHNMRATGSGATILINAATTMKAFGKTNESIPLFEEAEQTYVACLNKDDYRFAPLYNNMALSFAEVGDIEKAEDYFYRALEHLERIDNSECDRAVTYCNLAEMTENENYLKKAAQCLKEAKKDAYYYFTLSKCKDILGDLI